MESWISSKLNAANKLIFVKRYSEAKLCLEAVLADPRGSKELLVHLRRIELAAMLREIDTLYTFYEKQISADLSVAEADNFRLLMALTSQHADTIDLDTNLQIFTDHLTNHGPSAAAYYGIGLVMEAKENYERALFNYEQCIACDADWFPSYFGLSQVSYYLGNDKRGDHYFYLFEQAAPFNVYGNFETHRSLSQEFADQELYVEAEDSVRTLSEWWVDHRGACPKEIQIYEQLATGKLAELRGDRQQYEQKTVRAQGIADALLGDSQVAIGVLYFVAKLFEEFHSLHFAFDYYKQILGREASDPTAIKKIGGQFLAQGEYSLAKELFVIGCERHRSSEDLRLCSLIASLKENDVDVDEYLSGRERLRQLVEMDGDKAEVLALLHGLQARYQEDPIVHGHMGDTYLQLGNIKRAVRHYKSMLDLDEFSPQTHMKYASFAVFHCSIEDAVEALDQLILVSGHSESTQCESTQCESTQSELTWLRASVAARQDDFEGSNLYLQKVLEQDPWNVNYLVRQITNSLHLTESKSADRIEVDDVLKALQQSDGSDRDWLQFEQKTAQFEAAHDYGSAYPRRKLAFLYRQNSPTTFSLLVKAAARFDPNLGTRDFIKLINTNFDSPAIYWALGVMQKELWQLEAAGVWFNQMLHHPTLSTIERATAYLEIADCLVCQSRDLGRAIEYAKLARELRDDESDLITTVLCHAYLANGLVNEARNEITKLKGNGQNETIYLEGLLEYRNGAKNKANKLWKPLLTKSSSSTRWHHIKQTILKYYFDSSTYPLKKEKKRLA